MGVSAGYSLTSSSSEGAILTLPEGAASLDLYNIAEFRRYIMENAISWYEFVNTTLGREAPNGSLYLVTGCDKSTTWGVTSISCTSGTDALSLKFTAAQLIEAGATRDHSWETFCPATVRTGPQPSQDQELPQNQCIFLRGFKVMVRDGPIAKMRGTVKVTSVLDADANSIIPTLVKERTTPFSACKKYLGRSGNTHSGNTGTQDGQHQLRMHAKDAGKPGYTSNKCVILEDFPGTNEA